MQGQGNDTFTGGLGKDVFICSTGSDTITDFNITQNDTPPQQNDCEKIKYGNIDYYVSLQQKHEEEEQHEQEDLVHTETTTKDKKKKSGSNDGFFFGLFK